MRAKNVRDNGGYLIKRTSIDVDGISRGHGLREWDNGTWPLQDLLSIFIYCSNIQYKGGRGRGENVLNIAQYCIGNKGGLGGRGVLHNRVQ